MEVEASCYNYGFHPAGRGRQWHQPPPPPPPHPPPEDGELWEYFPCPFCYIEVEVPFICNHLQEEHCFDTRNAVCPICANNLGRDMAAHFRVEHSHLLKRRKPSKPCAWPPQAASASEFDEPQHQQHYYQEQEPAPDPLLSHFICSSVDAGNATPDDHTKGKAAAAAARTTASHDNLGLQERLQRIDFLTEILMSTIL